MLPKSDYLSIEILQTWLVNHHIPIQEWGSGNAKTILHLFDEIKKGECELQDNPPKRVLPVVQVIIQRNDLVLMELEQELSDSRKRKRCLPPSEKMKPGESWPAAAARCLDEELSLKPYQFTMLSKNCSPVVHERFSQSYPGLPSQYHVYTVRVRADSLPDTDFWTKEKEGEDCDATLLSHRWGWVADHKVTLL